MCNIYQISAKKGLSQGVRGKVSAAVAKLPNRLVHKSDQGIVVLSGDRVEVMRWGFHRSFNPAINNARADKLEAGMWTEAFHKRRCVIPVSAYFEWGPGIGGHKQAYEFSDPDDDYLWIAGLWEDGEGDLGSCFTMITTASPPLMAPIHDRMPAVLRPAEMAAFLVQDSRWDFRPFDGQLVVTPCVSPLAKPRDTGAQQELL